MNNQHLFLELSTRRIPSPQIIAANFNAYHVSLCSCVTLWLRDQREPLYFWAKGVNAQNILDWANSQPAEQFLALPPSWIFNASLIEERWIARDAGTGIAIIAVRMAGMTPFYIEEVRAETLAAWRSVDWTGGEDDDATQPRTVAVLA